MRCYNAAHCFHAAQLSSDHRGGREGCVDTDTEEVLEYPDRKFGVKYLSKSEERF